VPVEASKRSSHARSIKRRRRTRVRALAQGNAGCRP
jgi:hypothetical protein